MMAPDWAKRRAVLEAVKGASAPLRGDLRSPLTVSARGTLRNLAGTEKPRLLAEQKNQGSSQAEACRSHPSYLA